MLIKLLHCFGMYISPLNNSLVITCLFIYSCNFYYYYCYYLLVYLFLFSFFFVLFIFFIFSTNCFYLFSYLFFSLSFLLFFIGLPYCVCTDVQVFLLANKFNIFKYSTKNIIWLYVKIFNWCKLYNGKKYITYLL